jgi:HEAT repeat protein
VDGFFWLSRAHPEVLACYYITQQLKANCHNPLLGRTLLAGVSVILMSAASLWAHSEQYFPPGPPQPPPIPMRQDQVLPLRWSWVHWWEANRSLYLRPPWQGGKLQDAGPAGIQAIRAEASGALLAALGDPQIEPRAAAALALGRLGAPAGEGVLEQLIAHVRQDPSEQVRFRALLAVGLIGGEDSESFLIGYDPPSLRLRASAVIAMGFLRSPTDRTLAGLRDMISKEVPAVRLAALWALSQHKAGIDADTYLRLLRRDPSPWMASYAELELGVRRDKFGDRLLVQIVTDGPSIGELAAWQLLASVRKQKLSSTSVKTYLRWVDAHRRLFSMDPTARPLGEKPPDFRGIKAVWGIEDIYRARLRSSAAIALAGAGDPAAADRFTAVATLRRLVNERPDDYNTAPKCFALVSLGQIGSPQGLEDLLRVASDTESQRPKPQVVLESPLRGFAMIALGLYARPYDSPQGVSNRPGYERAIAMLQGRLLDKGEKLEVRAACAVALGLSARTANLRPLIMGYEELDGASPLLGGYALLGRAMLGDRNLIGPVRAALARKPDYDETTDLLARRAAVLSLGVVGTGEVIPELVRAWDEPFYVNREVILALSLCEAPGVAGHVLPALSGSGNQYERAYMAQIVGMMLTAQDPPPLSRFLTGSNFTMKDGLMEPYRRISNRFLYEYLIPQFGGGWH